MQTIGHHTCSKEHGEHYVLVNSPFRSNYHEPFGKLPFLGSGYYFWDYNYEIAENWGFNHYNGNFFILEFVLQIPDELFLDLVGSRQAMEYIKMMISKMKDFGFDRPEWSLGAVIESLKKINAKTPGSFPFEVVRAVDNSALKEEVKVIFVDSKKNYTNLNPRLVICFLTKKEVFFESKKIVFSSK